MRKSILFSIAIMLCSICSKAQQQAPALQNMRLLYTYYKKIMNSDSATVVRAMNIQEAYRAAVRDLYGDKTLSYIEKMKRRDKLDSAHAINLEAFLTPEQLRPFSIVQPRPKARTTWPDADSLRKNAKPHQQ